MCDKMPACEKTQPIIKNPRQYSITKVRNGFMVTPQYLGQTDLSVFIELEAALEFIRHKLKEDSNETETKKEEN